MSLEPARSRLPLAQNKPHPTEAHPGVACSEPLWFPDLKGPTSGPNPQVMSPERRLLPFQVCVLCATS